MTRTPQTIRLYSPGIAFVEKMAAGCSSSKADVFIRIRPENKKEQKYKSKGKEKFLEDYDDHSITIGGRKGKTSNKVYDYPRLVLGPTCSQEDAYVSLGLDDLLNKFLFENQDVSVLAYGQTGNKNNLKISVNNL